MGVPQDHNNGFPQDSKTAPPQFSQGQSSQSYTLSNGAFIPSSSASTSHNDVPSDLPPPYQEIAPSSSRSPAPLSTPLSSIPPSSRLIAIPATDSKLGSPFLRAYPPVLRGSDISPETFLDFIDHLNRATVASPPVQVLGLAGSVVGFVPLATAQIVGTSVEVAARLTTFGMSKGRTEMLLRDANRDIFGPRGLKVQIAKLDAVAKMTGMPVLDAKGKVNKKSSILAPFEDETDLHSLSMQHRRMAALGPWLSPLDIDSNSLPVIERQENPWSRMHAAVSESQRKKEEKKMLKERSKAHSDYVKESRKNMEEREDELRKLAREEEKILRKGERKDKDMTRKMEKVERERQKVEREYEREMRKVEKDRRKDDKEEESLRKILFLIVRPEGEAVRSPELLSPQETNVEAGPSSRGMGSKEAEFRG